MDCIRIRRLEVFAKHGVLPEENVLGQKFLISASLYCDIGQAGRTDDINCSVNYALVSEVIKQETEKNTFRLIERLAEHLAEQILLRFPLLEKVDIKVEKPWAPVGIGLESVCVEISRGWHRTYLGIGSNLGDREENLNQALQMLDQDGRTKIEKKSGFLETKPVGEVEQDDFLNGVVCVRTLRTPQELLELIHHIESGLKRVRLVHWGPRTIDLDILLYDDCRIYTEELVIPHPELKNRGFVLIPFCEIAPYVLYPGSGQTMKELLGALQKQEKC